MKTAQVRSWDLTVSLCTLLPHCSSQDMLTAFVYTLNTNCSSEHHPCDLKCNVSIIWLKGTLSLTHYSGIHRVSNALLLFAANLIFSAFYLIAIRKSNKPNISSSLSLVYSTSFRGQTDNDFSLRKIPFFISSSHSPYGTVEASPTDFMILHVY